jgi:hypothetical protein
MSNDFQFLAQFQSLFAGHGYKHRSSTHGDWVAQFIFEDLVHLNLSSKFKERVVQQRSVLNSQNRAHGVHHRRGDGSFGALIPGDDAIIDPGFIVGRGPIANIEVGIEVKILAKAMIKQIDRVKNDLRKQVGEFRRTNPRAIIAVAVGVNHAAIYRSYEGERQFITDGKKYKHPASESAAAIQHIEQLRSEIDELLILNFRATNLEPFPFEWVSATATWKDYASFLVRTASLFDHRF